MPNTQTQKPISTNHHLGLRVHPGSLLYEGGNAWLPAAERETGPRKLGMRKLLLCLRGTGTPPDSLCGYPASFVVCRSQEKRLLCTCLEGLKRPSGGLWGGILGTAIWSFLFKFLEQVSTLKRGCKPLHSLVRIPSNPSPPHGKTAQATHVSQINPAPSRPRAREKAVGPRGAEAES